MSPTNWIGRVSPTTNWGQVRIGGAYLMTRAGEYILTRAGEKIIIRVPGGDLNTSNWIGRPTI